MNGLLLVLMPKSLQIIDRLFYFCGPNTHFFLVFSPNFSPYSISCYTNKPTHFEIVVNVFMKAVTYDSEYNYNSFLYCSIELDFNIVSNWHLYYDFFGIVKIEIQK